MKKILNILIMFGLTFSILPGIFAVSVGSGIGVDIDTEDFEPLVWSCGDRIISDDFTQPGRFSNGSEYMFERMANYAFEGEQIQWTVLVMDKNGINKVEDVYATLGPTTQGAGNDIEVNCVESPGYSEIVEPFCHAMILGENLTGEPIDTTTQRYYTCTLTVETPASMYEEHFITVEAVDLSEPPLYGTMAENEYWFFNPEIALDIEGDLIFTDVVPGTPIYSDTILISNNADDGSGVLLDMFISGTDFYDSSDSGAMCPTTNQLSLGQFSYFVSNGAYTSQMDPRGDVESYVGIGYGIGFNNPNPFYGNFYGDPNGYEILQTPVNAAGYYAGNILTPGSEMAITFKLDLPSPCNGDFDTGQIYFWGEAI